MKIFKQVRVNILLFDAIKQVHFYAKFHKDFALKREAFTFRKRPF